MKVLVTGATGFLGGHLVQKLIKRGYEIRALVRESSDLQYLKDMQVELFKGNLRDKKSLKGIIDGIDLVIHAGACTRGTRQEYKEGTIIGTQNILELASNSEITKLVYISSIDVYSVNEVAKDSLINEATDMEKHPEKVGPYAESKIISEKIVYKFMQSGKFAIVIVRPGIIYGPRRKTTFLPHIGFSLLGGKVFLKIGNGRKILPLTYIDNTIEAIIQLLENKKADGQIYNIIDPREINQKQYLNYHFKSFGIKGIKLAIPYTFFLFFGFLNEKLSKVPKLGKYFGLTRYRINAKYKKVRYDGTKIIRHLNWYPPVKLEEGLDRTLNWLKNYKKSDLRN